ncbi:heavy metal transport/detoxification superfamily protein [Striga asiatica]|uniref:Heavy metal transport/detoxification superfamily protein n=1 Tax=Striga asiatica TaxID=4170 RepID=A0A5A7PAL1_STRAF|nr:heavy metal transport/detoxification superfamily protein [Striga asiatica]
MKIDPVAYNLTQDKDRWRSVSSQSVSRWANAFSFQSTLPGILMDYSPANLCCVLKFDAQCGACKGHMFEILRCIEGVYDVAMDAQSKTVKIMGQVNPNYCLKALTRCGMHAELVWANLSHPKMQKDSSYHYRDYNRNYSDGRIMYNYRTAEPYGYRRSLPQGMWHETPSGYPMMMGNNVYSTNTYYEESRRNPLLDYYNQESMSLCSIL